MTFHNSGITTYYLLFLILCYPTKVLADVVQWLERLLAKEKVAGSTPVIRSNTVTLSLSKGGKHAELAMV